MSRQDEWTRESAVAALERLRAAAKAHRATPVVLVYTRQSVSDFDAVGRPRGPSLSQQLDAVLRRPELEGIAFEQFEDADRSGKETSRRLGYLALMDRLHRVRLRRQRSSVSTLSLIGRGGCTSTGSTTGRRSANDVASSRNRSAS